MKRIRKISNSLAGLILGAFFVGNFFCPKMLIPLRLGSGQAADNSQSAMVDSCSQHHHQTDSNKFSQGYPEMPMASCCVSTQTRLSTVAADTNFKTAGVSLNLANPTELTVNLAANVLPHLSTLAPPDRLALKTIVKRE